MSLCSRVCSMKTLNTEDHLRPQCPAESLKVILLCVFESRGRVGVKQPGRPQGETVTWVLQVLGSVSAGRWIRVFWLSSAERLAAARVERDISSTETDACLHEPSTNRRCLIQRMWPSEAPTSLKVSDVFSVTSSCLTLQTGESYRNLENSLCSAAVLGYFGDWIEL